MSLIGLRFLLVSLISLLTLVPDARAQVESASLVGFVRSETGRTVSDASVVLIDLQTGHQRYGSATDASGRYSVRAIRPGRYRVNVSHVSYGTRGMVVALAPGEEASLDLVLDAAAVPQDEVVVTGTRMRRRTNPVTVSNMTARDLELQPAMKDLPVLLSTLPSLTYHTENGNGIGYSTLRMRGFDQRRVAVSINGIPQNDPEDFNVFWINFFDIQGAVEDIQVQRGAGSSQYGPTAIGGSINIAAFPYRAQPYAFAEAGLGTFNTRRYTVEGNSGLLNDRYVLFGRFSRLLTDGYRDWSWSEFYRFFVGAVRYGERSSLTLQAYGGPQRDGLAFSGIPRAANERSVPDGFGGEIDRKYNFSALTGDIEQFHQPHVELFHDWSPSGNLSFHQALFWVKGEGYFDFGGTFRSADYLRLPEGWRDLDDVQRTLPLFLVAPDAEVLFRAYLDQWQVGWLPRMRSQTALGESTVGLEVRLHRSERWGRVQEAEGLPPEVVGAEADARVYRFRGEKSIASAYVSHQVRPAERLLVQGDVQATYRRYRHYDEAFFEREFGVPYRFINPRLGVTLNPERRWSGYASISLASREPRLKSLYDGEEAGAGFSPRFRTGPNGVIDYERPLVKPERLTDLEVGLVWSGHRARLSTNAFLMDFRDEIVPSGGLDQFGVPRSGNAERTRHIGLEVEAAIRLARGLDLDVNATLSRNRFVRFSEFIVLPDQTVAEADRDGNPIAGFPERVLNARLLFARGGWAMTLSAKAAGRQYIDNSGGVNASGDNDDALTVDAYFVLDAGVRYAFSERVPAKGIEFALDVNNVLNSRVLLYGNVGPVGPQFFPLATRHVFARIRYTL